MERQRLQPRPQARKKVKSRSVVIPSFKSRPLNHYIALMLLILVGVIIGALYIRNSGVGKSSLEGTGFFMQDILSLNAASKGFASLAASAFFPISMMICAAFLFGLCAIGFPLELAIPVFHGIWLGAAMSSIDIRYGVKGLGICLLFIMPQALITSLAVMVASREGFRFSRSVSKAVFSGTQQSLVTEFRTYCFKYIVCFLLVAAASMIEALSVLVFSKMFFS